MSSLLKKMRGDRKGWYKVSDLVEGVEIAVPSKTGEMIWDEIVSITPVGREQVYDIEVEGTHNFIGNGIFAHNTYVLRANTMLAVEGEVHAEDFIVPIGNAAGAEATSGMGTTTLMAEIPSAVLTADGTGVDLYKLATYNLAAVNVLAARMDEESVRVTSLESRVTALESGAVSSEGTSFISLSTTSLASVFESLGVFIQKGIAQFGTLVFDQFVAATDSAGTSSAGTVTILAGNTVAQVTNAYVTPLTKVFVTFTASTIGSWYISDKQNGSFKVVLENPQVADTTFDYFLVQTEGQIATSTPQAQNIGGSTGAAITLIGDSPLHLSVGGTFVEPGIITAGGAPYITFINGLQQEVNTSTIDTSIPTTYIITYKTTDAAGNSATVIRAVIVGNPDGTVSIGAASSTPPSSDTTVPVVTLTGAAALELAVGDTFTDPGATATDDVDGDLTSSIVVTGAVDTAVAGLYTLTYSATDTALNTGNASRVITVTAPSTTP